MIRDTNQRHVFAKAKGGYFVKISISRGKRRDSGNCLQRWDVSRSSCVRNEYGSTAAPSGFSKCSLCVRTCSDELYARGRRDRKFGFSELQPFGPARRSSKPSISAHGLVLSSVPTDRICTRFCVTSNLGENPFCRRPRTPHRPTITVGRQQTRERTFRPKRSSTGRC